MLKIQGKSVALRFSTLRETVNLPATDNCLPRMPSGHVCSLFAAASSFSQGAAMRTSDHVLELPYLEVGGELNLCFLNVPQQIAREGGRAV
ncbi:MAG: hypothetical protein K2V38_25360, partial [Gemmataceae bacterium]|nr:hypothetical protein [Gemmataceae bacterium]